jgi:hypothetical protein
LIFGRWALENQGRIEAARQAFDAAASQAE